MKEIFSAESGQNRGLHNQLNNVYKVRSNTRTSTIPTATTNNKNNNNNKKKPTIHAPFHLHGHVTKARRTIRPDVTTVT